MGYFIGIAFWISLSGCLLTKSYPISDFGVDYLLEHVVCPSDSTFYAPRNVEKQCITTALDCVRRELKGTVKEECEDPFGYVDDAVIYLDRQIEERKNEKRHALTDSGECACERWPEAKYSDFVVEVFSLLQLQNSDSSR